MNKQKIRSPVKTIIRLTLFGVSWGIGFLTVLGLVEYHGQVVSNTTSGELFWLIAWSFVPPVILLGIRSWLYRVRPYPLAWGTAASLALTQFIALSFLISWHYGSRTSVASPIPIIALVLVIVLMLGYCRSHDWPRQLFRRPMLDPGRWLLAVGVLLTGAIIWLAVYFNLVNTLADTLGSNENHYTQSQKYDNQAILKIVIDEVRPESQTIQAHFRISFPAAYLLSIRDAKTHLPIFTSGEWRVRDSANPRISVLDHSEGYADKQIKIRTAVDSKEYSVRLGDLVQKGPLYRYSEEEIYSYDTAPTEIRNHQDYSGSSKLRPAQHYPSDRYYFIGAASLVLPDGLRGVDKKMFATIDARKVDANAKIVQEPWLVGSKGLETAVKFEVTRSTSTKLFIYAIALAPMLLLVILASLILAKTPTPSHNSYIMGIGLAILVILPLRQVLVPATVTSITHVDLILGFELVSAAFLIAINYVKELARSLQNPNSTDA